VWLAHIEQGIRYRREWDRRFELPDERDLLRSELVASQRACLSSVSSGAEAERAVTEQFHSHGAYLALLIEKAGETPVRSAWAVECFRDDLQWAADLSSVLDGSRPANPASRTLAEEEMWLGELAEWRSHAKRGSTDEALITRAEEQARDLRVGVLCRVVERFDPSAPSTVEAGDRERWMSTASLLTHVRAERTRTSTDAMPPQLADRLEASAKRLEAVRRASLDSWRLRLAVLSPALREADLTAAVQELSDRAMELTGTLEESTPAEAATALDQLAGDLEVCRGLIREFLRPARSEPAQGDDRARRTGPRKLKRRLKRVRRQVKTELNERRLEHRLERLLGRRGLEFLENFQLVALVLFVILLAVEGPLIRYERSLSGGTAAAAAFEGAAVGDVDRVVPGVVEITLAWLDAFISMAFLLDFGLRLSLAPNRWDHLKRHALTGLIPAIPFGFIAFALHHGLLTDVGERIVVLRFLRYARLPQLVRWLRVARPLVRALRMVFFVFRAGDELSRHLSGVLNRNLVFFERAALEEREPPHRAALAVVRERFIHRAAGLIEGLPLRDRLQIVLARLSELEALIPPTLTFHAATPLDDPTTAREVPFVTLAARLRTTTPSDVLAVAGQRGVERIRFWLRAVDWPPLNWLPVVRHLARAGREPEGTAAVVRAARSLGGSFQRFLDHVLGWADLYGTVTPPQLVDTLGEWMVRGTSRPARRFLILGGLFLFLTWLGSWVLPFETLEELVTRFKSFVATPLVVLGVICLVPMCLGLWLRRVASQATEFYEQVAEAQFVTATKSEKRRLAERRRFELDHRITNGGQAFPLGPQDRHDVAALWSDYLDSAPFHKSDVKTTTQLLGNLVLIDLRERRLRHGGRRRSRLRRLLIVGGFGRWRGPHAWFHFISRSLAQSTARLVIDYNANVLPLSRLATAPDQDAARYVAWMKAKLGRAPRHDELPSEWGGRTALHPDQARHAPPPPRGDSIPLVHFQGNDFTSAHFLSSDPFLQADILKRYGPVVADLLARDRRDNIRRVFRTYPFHHWPKSRRTINPLVVYERHLAGGRVLLLPFKFGALLLVAAARLVMLVGGVVASVLRPVRIDQARAFEADPFSVAVRKIHRMRQPVFLECLRIRAEFDPEYLGLSIPFHSTADQMTDGAKAAMPCLPTFASASAAAGATPIEADLGLVDPSDEVVDELRRLADARRTQLADLWQALAGWPGLPSDPMALRAAAMAYVTDHQGIRSRLEAVLLLVRAAETDAVTRGGWRLASVGHFVRSRWEWLRLRGRFDRVFRQPRMAELSPDARARLRRVVAAGHGGVQQAARTLCHPRAPADVLADTRQQLESVVRDWQPWIRQLVVLRAVQALTVIDLETYCDLVQIVGDYETDDRFAPPPTQPALAEAG
jgi:hypothetical protein